ncbi:hypothetical protein DFP72DRAFT_847376 [Ephemerocybe angulata]|uniref:Uncharacterized protein n=1 Tax=Ephemerocybe angulata TaxID=980116 RepID=A0A8H6HZ18_9AGAR|nr:hypothetical protein DFP72DRAFT_847376 [Tulosesus angulatus]
MPVTTCLPTYPSGKVARRYWGGNNQQNAQLVPARVGPKSGFQMHSKNRKKQSAYLLINGWGQSIVETMAVIFEVAPPHYGGNSSQGQTSETGVGSGFGSGTDPPPAQRISDDLDSLQKSDQDERPPGWPKDPLSALLHAGLFESDKEKIFPTSRGTWLSKFMEHLNLVFTGIHDLSHREWAYKLNIGAGESVYEARGGVEGIAQADKSKKFRQPA